MNEEADFELAACLERVRQQDEAAARALVEHLYPLVLKIIRRRLPRRAAEEDLAQEIFIKMFTHLNQYHGGVPFEHWVSRIAFNHCLNVIRAQKARPEWRLADLSEDEAGLLEKAAAAEPADIHPAQAISAKELVDKLLDTLDPADALVLRLLELEERSIREIQELTGWSGVLIRVRAFRARQKLNKRFKKLRSEEAP